MVTVFFMKTQKYIIFIYIFLKDVIVIESYIFCVFSKQNKIKNRIKRVFFVFYIIFIF